MDVLCTGVVVNKYILAKFGLTTNLPAVSIDSFKPEIGFIGRVLASTRSVLYINL
jgi:hypothetical protein